ncbi:MAG: hypothetical protein ACODAA_09710 [Gemmatimonadota bacterium]
MKLSRIAEALDEPAGWQCFLDRSTGKIVTIIEDEEPYLDGEGDDELRPPPRVAAGDHERRDAACPAALAIDPGRGSGRVPELPIDTYGRHDGTSPREGAFGR